MRKSDALSARPADYRAARCAGDRAAVPPLTDSAPAVAILMGETASGKSSLAVELAQRYDAEIIGADSRQIYRGMEIGTAAPSQAERNLVPHHLIGFADPRERYSAAQFTIDVHRKLTEIFKRGRRAIVVGGTGFYIRALTGEMQLGKPAASEIRDRMRREERLHDSAFLYEWLRLRDPARAEMLHPNDTYRVGQALERALGRDVPAPESGREIAVQPLQSAYEKFWLQQPAEELEARIVRRVDAMLAAGFIDEAERIGLDAVAASAVGYDCIFAYLRGQATAGELRASLIRKTRQYAKRQRTWLRREPGVTILDGTRDAAGTSRSIADFLAWTKV